MIGSPELLIRSTEARITIGGSVDAHSAAGFAEALRSDVGVLVGSAERIELDLDDLELCDATAVAEALNALRWLAGRVRLVVRRAPQMLAHALYKAGLLRDGRIVLEAVRDEEATSS
jgi:hypothetical protein